MIIITPVDLAHAVRERRKQMRLSQGALARRANVSRTWLAELERGKPTAEVGLVLNTLLTLGLRVDVRDAAADSNAIAAPDAAAAPEAAQPRRLRTSRALWRRPTDAPDAEPDDANGEDER